MSKQEPISPEQLGSQDVSGLPPRLDPKELGKVVEVLEKSANEINGFDPESAARLFDVIRDLKNATYERLANIQLYDAVNPSAIEERAAQHFQEGLEKQPQWYRRFEVVRNVLVVGPILVTWFFLALASFNYAQTIVNDPEASGKPFLLLWEQGFSYGILTWFKFSYVAFIDLGLLVLIALLTYVHHHNIENNTVTAKENARSLRRRLENALWGLHQIFAQLKVLQSPDQLANHMEITATKLEAYAGDLERVSKEVSGSARIVNQVQQKLLQDQSRVGTQFLQINQDLSATVGQAAASVTEMKESTKATETNFKEVNNSLTQYVAKADETAKAFSGIQQGMGVMVGNLNSLSSEVKNAAAKIDQAAQAMSSNAVAAGNLTPQFTQLGNAISGIEKKFESVTQELNRIAQANGTNVQSMQGVQSQVQLLVAEVTPQIQSFVQFVQANSQAFGNMNQNLASANTQLQQQINYLNSLLQQMNQLTPNIQTFGQQLQNTFGGLANQINQLQKQIGQIQSVGVVPGTKRSYLDWLAIVMLSALAIGGGLLLIFFVAQANWLAVGAIAVTLLTLLALLAFVLSRSG